MRNRDTSLPLSAYRVLDLTDAKGFLCARILGDMGADVIKIEPPGGDPDRSIGPFYNDRPHRDRSLSYWAYNTNKRSMTLDLENASGRRTFLRMARAADFVIESKPVGYLKSLGLDYRRLAEVNPSLVMTSISPFGQSGPYKSYKDGDIVAMATGGLLYLAGNPERRPVVIGVPQSYCQAGAQAAAGTMIAHFHRLRTGKGQYVDLSMQEAVTDSLDWVQQYYDTRQVICTRGGTPGLKIHRNWVWECKDGYVSWVWWVGAGWGRKNIPLLEMMKEDGIDEGLLQVPWEEKSLYKLPQEEVDKWESAFRRFFRGHTVGEMVDAAAARRILLFPINGPKRVVENEQLKARGLFVDLKPYGIDKPVKFPGPPLKSTAPLWRSPAAAPRAGQHTSQVMRELATWKRAKYPPDPVSPSLLVNHLLSPTAPLARGAWERNKKDGVQPSRKGALEGIKVADFTWLVAGPTVSKYLAMFGATVVKVESSTRLDGTRQTGPFAGKPTFNSSAQFANHNASKLSLGVNMTDPRGLEVARKLANWADVIVENFTPGVMAKWGLGYNDIRKTNPGVVMLSTSFQGQTGPAAMQSGYASLLHALCGINHVTGWPDLPPVDLGAAYGDLIGVWFAIATVAAALDRRSKTGKGVAIDLSQFESSIHFLAPAILDYTVNGREWARQGNRSENAAPHNVYRCADDAAAGSAANDRWCAIACYTEQEWLALCKVLDNASLAKEPRFATQALRRRNADALDALIDGWTGSRKAEEVMRTMQKAGVPAGVVASGYDLHADAQMRHRGHMVKLQHAQMGLRTYDAPSFRLSRTPHEMRAAPLLGEHTHYVVTSLLGMSDGEFAELLGAGVLEQES